MLETINERVSIILISDSNTRSVKPYKMKWRGREYLIKNINMHHKRKDGKLLFHVFSVSTDSIYFKLEFNTDNLLWTLVDTYDNDAGA